MSQQNEENYIMRNIVIWTPLPNIVRMIKPPILCNRDMQHAWVRH